MKKSIILIGVFSITLLMVSCGGSTKGKWTDEDKKKFSDECTGVKEMKELGETGTKLCDCMLSKSEMDFNSFKEADSDEAKMTTFGEACAVEVMAGNETPAETGTEAPADSTVQAE
jgi:hypothetical protein